MPEDSTHHTGTRSPRLDRDTFRLTPWARNRSSTARNGRRNSTRATVDDAPTETPGEPATLDAFGQQTEG